MSGVLFSMIVRWQVSGIFSRVSRCQCAVLYDSEMAGVRHVFRSVVLYGSEMAGVRHVSEVLFSMIVSWHVAGMCQECCTLW